MQETIKQYEMTLNNSKLQYESSSAKLEKKNKELQKFKDQTIDIVYGKRQNDKKVEKIIEVIKSSNSNNF